MKPKLTPRALIMSLLNAPHQSTLTIGQLIRAGALFEFEATSIRMTVTRLIKDKLISNVERGVYQAGERALTLKSEIQSWRSTNKKVRSWGGDWLLALSGHLGRTNKTQLRSMVRAFHLYGFAEIESGVWLRPANLVQTVEQLRSSLINIGLDERVYLFNATKIAGDQQKQWHASWPVDDLEASYSKMIETIEKSSASLNEMPHYQAAKESLMIGESAIRLINLDPLLPEEIINSTLFKQVVTHMLNYDKVGQRHWQRFLAEH